MLLSSAAWRMTLYISAYGLSFKRCMTYWGMVMMALFLLSALGKIRRPENSFCRRALPLALAGWLAINCIPVDARYLLYHLSYDTLSQLERLDGDKVYQLGGGHTRRLADLLEERREAARADCAGWRGWNLSACLAAGGG